VKKRILIISYFFAPQNIIGAVRATKMAKYLTRMGHEVTVICGPGRTIDTDPTLERDLQELTDVHMITEWNPIRSRQAQKSAVSAAPSASSSPASPSRLAGVKDAVYRYVRWLTDRDFRNRAIRELDRLQGTYDVVFSSYAPFSVHEIAREAKRRGFAKRWIADFRDEVFLFFRWQNGHKERYMRMLRREADILTAVSSGFLEMMQFDDIGRVLSNGFDREDLPAIEAVSHSGKLRVVYCGQLIDSRSKVGKRDITPVFRALRRLADEHVIAAEELELVYAGREGALFADYAARSGLEDCIADHGQVSRERSIALQKSADVLVMASVHLSSQKGILTGKLFEYMMMDKPIICCMSGDLTGSGVKQVLGETGMGVCCEQAAGQADEEALTAYVRRLILLWREGRSMLEGQNREAVEAYAYPKLAETLASWMNEK